MGEGHGGSPVICIAGNVADRNANCNGAGVTEGISYTLNTVDKHVLCVDCRHGTEDDTAQTLTGGNGGRGYSLNQQPVIHRKSGLWRLTPLECERLQGYPDGWTDIGDWVDDKGRTRKSSDTARYKALGNSIALPPWKWVLKRISAKFEKDATMGSLFDGIGGFPLLWEQMTGTVYFTRMDDAKDVNLRRYMAKEPEEKKKKETEAATQMRYEVEYLCPGSILYHEITVAEDATLEEIGVLVTAMEEFAKDPVLGGMSGKGFGLCDVAANVRLEGDKWMDISNGKFLAGAYFENAAEMYTKQIAENADAIIDFLGGVPLEQENNKAAEGNLQAV